MIETISWVLIAVGLAIILFSYAKYFLGGRKVKSEISAADEELDAGLIDPEANLNSLSLDQGLMERALHVKLPESQRSHSARLPTELDPIFDDLQPSVEISNSESYAEEVQLAMSPEEGEVLFEEPQRDLGETQAYMPMNDPEFTCLTVVAKAGRVLSGAAIKGQFEGRGLEFTDKRIFQSYFSDQPVYSVVNAVEPGYFDIETMEAMTTPGICFLLQLPGPMRDDVGFDMMLSDAHEISQALDAELRDEHGAPLTRNSLEETRARLIRSANERYGSNHDHA